MGLSGDRLVRPPVSGVSELRWRQHQPRLCCQPGYGSETHMARSLRCVPVKNTVGLGGRGSCSAWPSSRRKQTFPADTSERAWQGMKPETQSRRNLAPEGGQV